MVNLAYSLLEKKDSKKTQMHVDLEHSAQLNRKINFKI